MSIKVTLVDEKGSLPFIVEFGHVKQFFTKKALIELKNKSQEALDELAVKETQ